MHMKKIIVCLLACLNLSACVNAGDFDLLPVRKKIFNLYKGYAVDFYDNKEELVGNERIHENDYQLNKAVTVKKGEDVLSDTLMDKKTYQRFFIKFNKKGSLDNRIYPMNVNADDEYKIVGWTTIDGQKYSLVESPLDDYVFLFDEQGSLYDHGGKIIDDLADEAFFNDLGIDAAFASGRLGDKSLMAELYYADGSLARSLNTLNNDAGTDIPGKNGSYVVGGLCISAKDLAKLVCILANDGIYEDKQYLSAESVELMETPFCQTDYHGVEVTQCMPLKFNTNIYGQRSLYFHTGSAYGVYALITYNPDTKDGVAVVTTGASGAQDEYGIYAICGDISEMLYTSLKQDWKTTLSPMDTLLLGIESE